MKKDLAAQNLILIASGEDPDDFANWDGTGWYIPPLGTSPSGVTTATLDNSTTAANNTPDVPSYEIVRGKASLQYTTDEDNKESMDVSSRQVEYDPGKNKIETAIDLWDERGTSRYGAARAYHPTNRQYRESQDYPRYATMVISHPKDTSGNPLQVNDLMSKSSIVYGEKVLVLWDQIFKSKNPMHEAGEKIRYSLPGNAVGKLEFVNYEFGLELLADGAITASTNYSLDSQPKMPTRLQYVVSSYVAGGDIIFVGTNWRGEAQTETVTIGAAGTFYTKKFFKTIDASGVQVQTSVNCNLEINANELI